MFETELLQYGSLGLFTAYLVYDRQILLKSMRVAVENSTKAMNEVKHVIVNCKKK